MEKVCVLFVGFLCFSVGQSNTTGEWLIKLVLLLNVATNTGQLISSHSSGWDWTFAVLYRIYSFYDILDYDKMMKYWLLMYLHSHHLHIDSQNLVSVCLMLLTVDPSTADTTSAQTDNWTETSAPSTLQPGTISYFTDRYRWYNITN